ncbi:MAG TPA: serine hydrolase domain-containing protein [Candidatus Binatia bacterium]|nr:serine hydrolase domain-containing protein [Candidatus Binatia bacterium]
MMRRLALPMLGLCLLVAAHSFAQQQLTDKVDRVFADWNTTSSPGCALAVVKDGHIVYEHGYGMANLELNIAITPQSVFDIGSVSKHITAMAMLLLVQEHKLSLDDDIRKYLPEIPDYGSTITIRHMLHHTSGLRNYDDLFDLEGIPEADLTTDRDAMDLIVRQKGVNFKPGEEFLYSDTNYFLMSQIVKRVTGQTLRQFAQDRIFGPLGMTSTHFHDDHTMIVPRRATGYAPHKGGGFEMDMSNFEQLGDGSVMTTVEDLAKWDQNFEHPAVGGADAIRQLTTPGTLNNGQPIPYAMGLFIDHYRGLNWVHHSGEWVGYRAALSRFPDQHFSTLVTCNCIGSMSPMTLALRVADIYLADDLSRTEKTSPAKPASAATDASIKQYVGTYWSEKNGALRKFVLQDGKLIMVSPGMTYDLLPLGNGQFEALEADIEHKDKYTFHAANDASFQLEAVEGGVSVPYEAVKVTTLDTSRLADYAGSYSNDELRATWTLVVKDGKLIRQQWMNEDAEVEPAFPDGFIGDISEGQFVMHFNRDKNGRVTSFDAATDMVRPLRFLKTADHSQK